MRIAIVLVAGIACGASGCKPTGTSIPGQTTVDKHVTTQGPAPREVHPAITAPTKEKDPPAPKPDTGVDRKTSARRSTDDLLKELEHFETKLRLPILVELAKRSKDKDKIVPRLGMMQTNGEYAVRVAAAAAAVALDPDNVLKHATTLQGALGTKYQHASYGPLRETTPELTQIQKLAVPGLVVVLERELKEMTGKPGQAPQSSGAMSALSTFPADIGKPAVDVLRRIARTPMNHNAGPAADLLKKWGVSAD